MRGTEQGRGDGGQPSPPPSASGAGPPEGKRRRWPRWLPAPKVLLVAAIVIAFGVLVYRIRGDLSTACAG